jgi:ATP-dependent DNA helicase RecQ
MGEIAAHVEAQPQQTFEGNGEREAKPLGDSEYDTLRRFRAGQAVEQIARERDIKETTVMGHLSRAAYRGEEVDVSRFVSAEAEPEVAAAFEKLGWANLTGVRELLGERYEYDVLRIYRAARRPAAA